MWTCFKYLFSATILFQLTKCQNSQRKIKLETKLGRRFIIMGPVGGHYRELGHFVAIDGSMKSFKVRIESIRQLKVRFHLVGDGMGRYNHEAYNLVNTARIAHRIRYKRKPSWVSLDDSMKIDVEFINNSHIDVEIYVIPLNREESPTKLAVLLKKGQKIFCANKYTLINWDHKNLLIDSDATRNVNANTYKAVAEQCRNDEKCVGYIIKPASNNHVTSYIGQLITGIRGSGGDSPRHNSISFFIDDNVARRFGVRTETSVERWYHFCKNNTCTCIQNRG